MNSNDIEAARRLIAQFEDRAVGRHNSTMFRSRVTEMRPEVVERRDAQDARAGRMTIEQQEIELQFREALSCVRALSQCAGGPSPRTDHLQDVLEKELCALKRLRTASAQACKIMAIAKQAITYRYENIQVPVRDESPRSFEIDRYAEQYMHVETWNREKIVAELDRLRHELSTRR